MSKHTPGPWYWTESVTEGEWVIEANHSGFPSICNVTEIKKEWKCGDTLANARLIAAAPDFLDVVEALSEYAGDDEIPQQLIDAAHSAIAKAQGDDDETQEAAR